MNRLKLGCIADDFTGASDAASCLKSGGLQTVLTNGIPHGKLPSNAEAVVIALKTRTIPAEEAISISEEAVQWLLSQGAEKIYFKYCSTFDSTQEGNIGPVTDRLMALLDCDYTFVCPAMPDNGRIVYKDTLYVNGVPLGESSMRDHPLTPMQESCVSHLMAAQSAYPCFHFDEATEQAEEFLKRCRSNKRQFTFSVDCKNEEEAKRIVDLFYTLPLMTGGSGILRALAARLSGGHLLKQENEANAAAVRRVILAGSCSEMTRRQVAAYLRAGKRAIHMDVETLYKDPNSLRKLCRDLAEQNDDLLIYSTAEPDQVRMNQKWGQKAVSRILESAISELARTAAEIHVPELLVAGGETSGAAVLGMGFDQFYIGKNLSPGVPILHPVEQPDMRLVLKSGNFGGENLFLEGF